MNKRRILLTIICSLASYILPNICAAVAEPDTAEQVLAKKLANPEDSAQLKKNLRRKTKRMVNMHFENEDLVDVINYLAAERGVNVVLPVGANAIANKLTLHYRERIPLTQAWTVLQTALDIAGYSMIEKEDMITIVKNSKEIGREPTPIYINVAPEELPNTDQRIRYVHYLSNLRISDDANTGSSSEVIQLLKDILPDSSLYKLDPTTNSIIVADKSNNIKQVMKIISVLDEAEIQDKPTVIKLLHVPADWLAALLTEQILRNTTDPNKLRLLDTRKQSEATFFSRNIRIVAMPRNNRLVLLGKPQAVERLKDFIYKYIDVELDSGKSILHVYQLQYLDAEKFAPVLERIVESKKEGGTEQSRAGEGDSGALERYFGEVKIMVDRPKTASGELPEGVTRGSNNLIIAARTDDWEHIKSLIEKLDIPQPLVIIEVLIADLTAADLRVLGNALRNPAILSPKGVNFQASMLQPVTTNSNDAPTTLQADLLRLAYGDTAVPGSANAFINFLAPGSTFISASDPGTGSTWSIWQLLQSFASTRILAHPHVISTNNKKAEIIIKEERLLPDEASGTTGGTTTATRKWIEAKLSLEITPRISSAKTVNLNVVINISNFLTPSIAGDANSGNRTDRNVTTNANVPDGNVLCLGGLTRIDSVNNDNQTPLLGQIPIIGWFFKYRNGDAEKRNLMVFISPTIVEPRLRGGAGIYTRDQVEFAKAYSREGVLFDNLRDPITRWFFQPSRKESSKDLDDFIMRDELISRDLQRRGTLEGILSAENDTIVVPRPTAVAQNKIDKKDQLKSLLDTVELPKPKLVTSPAVKA